MNPWLLPLAGVGFIMLCCAVAAVIEYIDDKRHPQDWREAPPPNVRAQRPWLVEDDAQ